MCKTRFETAGSYLLLVWIDEELSTISEAGPFDEM